jgi:hypothetical protein
MNFQNNPHSQQEVEAVSSLLSQTALLLDETCALSYAFTMTLARTPRESLSSEEIDGLCQLAYEVLNKLTKTSEVFQETRQKLLQWGTKLGSTTLFMTCCSNPPIVC